MTEGGNNFMSTVLFIHGIVLSFVRMSLTDIDLVSGIILKWVTIISFMIVIVINIPKFWKTIKQYLKW